MLRVDKYLWAIRIYKTRSIAIEAIKGGKVKMNGDQIKPSREIRVGDILHIQQNGIQKTIKVLDLLPNRRSAKEVVAYFEDLTPIEEYQKIDRLKNMEFVYRPRGTGRPTKKERRDIDDLLSDEDD